MFLILSISSSLPPNSRSWTRLRQPKVHHPSAAWLVRLSVRLERSRWSEQPGRCGFVERVRERQRAWRQSRGLPVELEVTLQAAVGQRGTLLSSDPTVRRRTETEHHPTASRASQPVQPHPDSPVDHPVAALHHGEGEGRQIQPVVGRLVGLSEPKIQEEQLSDHLEQVSA